MQSFRQHEFVYVGTPEGALAHRDKWLGRGEVLLTQLGLSVQVVVANDPFFGRGGRLLAAGQREQELKYEIVSPMSSTAPGAITSANYHQDHFGKSFNLALTDGAIAHTACIGFGLERITLALHWKYGLNSDHWPKEVLERLSLA
jgi:seryl-tRNA synthetase